MATFHSYYDESRGVTLNSYYDESRGIGVTMTTRLYKGGRIISHIKNVKDPVTGEETVTSTFTTENADGSTFVEVMVHTNSAIIQNYKTQTKFDSVSDNDEEPPSKKKL